jgi:hypothetical protein
MGRGFSDLATKCRGLRGCLRPVYVLAPSLVSMVSLIATGWVSVAEAKTIEPRGAQRVAPRGIAKLLTMALAVSLGTQRCLSR